MAAPNAEEIELLKIFRRRLNDVLKTDEEKRDDFLIRWLRARELDLDKAENMLRASKEWRAANGIDMLLTSKPDPFFTDNYPVYIQWTDKLGQPVVYVPLGKWNFRKVVAEKKTAEFQMYIAYWYEKYLEEIRTRNRSRDPSLFPITQLTFLTDWAGFQYSQLVNPRAVQSMLQLSSIFEAHYPETMYRCVQFNYPSFFGVILGLVKSVAAPKTVEKLVCAGSEQKQWEPAMQELIGPDELAKIRFYNQLNH